MNVEDLTKLEVPRNKTHVEALETRVDELETLVKELKRVPDAIEEAVPKAELVKWQRMYWDLVNKDVPF